MKIKNPSDKIFSIKSNSEFENIALEIFNFQAENNLVYKKYLQYLNTDISKVGNIEKIPFLPVEFFKTQKILSGNSEKTEQIFSSSGTTGIQQSKHYISDISIYEKSFIKTFTQFYGKPSDYSIFALLPSYLEREGSSLIYMTNYLIGKAKKNSGFYLNNYNDLYENIKSNEKNNVKTILLGVTYALLDFAENYKLNLKNTIIIETGGMKGRREEITRNELHQILNESFGLQSIHSEYGMTELLSQAYSTGKNLFTCPNWMKIFIRDVYDPLSYVANGQSGGINVIDLANINSCSFLETKDIGKKYKNGGFEVLGRFDNSEIRGCNLLLIEN
jgi:phenylacetate-coenzyme A ligase PaaK-like adenylate-forming protein